MKFLSQSQKESAQLLSNETTAMTDNVSGRVIDNYADSVTLALAMYSSTENIFVKAVQTYYLRTDAEDLRESFVDIILKNEEEERTVYSRYWHGSMVFIKPLMVFLNNHEIRLLKTIVLFLLIIITEIILI